MGGSFDTLGNRVLWCLVPRLWSEATVREIDPVYILLWFIVFLFSLSVHESAHAYVADRFGDDTGRVLGRVSLNPIVHIDPLGTILFPLIGIFGGMMIGWAKPVPVNPLNWREKDKANFWTSAAGPLSNLVIATACFIILKVIMELGFANEVLAGLQGNSLLAPIGEVLKIGIFLNLLLMVFNLIPIPPLDGSHALESVLPPDARRGYEQLQPYGFILLIALLFTGALGYVMAPLQRFVVFLLLL